MKHFRLLIVLVCMAFSANALAEFKLYDVDPSYREEVYGVLARALRPQQGVALANSIELLPTGQILIDAMPETHQQVAAVLAEITNTPWGERHHYVVPAAAGAAPRLCARFDKQFHVSPFQPMEQQYVWTMSLPGERRDRGTSTSGHGRPLPVTRRSSLRVRRRRRP